MINLTHLFFFVLKREREKVDARAGSGDHVTLYMERGERKKNWRRRRNNRNLWKKEDHYLVPAKYTQLLTSLLFCQRISLTTSLTFVFFLLPLLFSFSLIPILLLLYYDPQLSIFTLLHIYNLHLQILHTPLPYFHLFPVFKITIISINAKSRLFNFHEWIYNSIILLTLYIA